MIRSVHLSPLLNLIRRPRRVLCSATAHPSQYCTAAVADCNEKAGRLVARAFPAKDLGRAVGARHTARGRMQGTDPFGGPCLERAANVRTLHWHTANVKHVPKCPARLERIYQLFTRLTGAKGRARMRLDGLGALGVSART
jgi:hypothetical protein